MNIMKLLLFFVLCFGSSISFATETELNIRVDNLENDKGSLQVSIFNDSNGFLTENKEFRIYRFDLTQSDKNFVIQDLPQGTYAMIIFHDENNNNDLDRSFIGVPKEGYGFSNNIKPKFSAPDFEDCSIVLDGKKEINISLNY